jgi:hypothetical protein
MDSTVHPGATNCLTNPFFLLPYRTMIDGSIIKTDEVEEKEKRK